MVLNDALRVPLAPSEVLDALQDLALLRASLDNCESLRRLQGGEYLLAMTVPLGPLRAHYQIRAHVASDEGAHTDRPRRTLNFKARAEGVGSLRGQIDVSLRTDDHLHLPGRGPSTRIDYSVWATATGPLAELSARQIENALHELADDFFTQFCAVVQAKHGKGPNRATGEQGRRQHVFLRPISLSGVARRARLNDHHHGGTLTGRAAHSLLHGLHHEHDPRVLPNWAWAAMIFLVALLLYIARYFTQG